MSKKHIEAHRELLLQRAKLQAAIADYEELIKSVSMRLETTVLSPTDRAKAHDKRRHTEGRMSEARANLFNVQAEIDHIRFEAEFL